MQVRPSHLSGLGWRCALHVAAALACLTLAGCGGGDSDHGDSSNGDHSNGGTTEANHGGQTAQVVTNVEPAPKPTGPLPEDASCVTSSCHATFATARHLHGPVSVEGCTACHQPDTGEHQYPLRRTGNDVCTFCHTVSGTKSHIHAAVEEPGCLSCHNQHTSQAKFLLNRSDVRQVCAQCHETPLMKHAHEPFADGRCTLCHQPHESENTMLLRGGEGTQHCLSCHTEMGEQLAEAEYTHRALVDQSCTECHDPHTSPHPRELKQPMAEQCASCHTEFAERLAAATNTHGAMDGDQPCGTCHNPHMANRPMLLAHREDQLCMQCHAQPTERPDGRAIGSMAIVLGRQNLHGPLLDGDCASCHEPHGNTHANLLRADFPETFYIPFELEAYELCFTCHNSNLVIAEQAEGLTSFRDGDRNLHYVHVNRRPKGRTCKTCHAVHASDLPNHMAETVPFEGSNWQMPIRYEKMETGGQCAPGCHEPMTYRRDAAAQTSAKDTGGES